MSSRTGSYRRDGVLERFTWTATGGGWRYAATLEDLATGAALGRLELSFGAEVAAGAGAEVRVHAEAGGWVLRAGTVGPDVLWRRGEQEHDTAADGVTGTSPAYAALVVSRLGLEVGGPLAVGDHRRLHLLAVTEPVLATRLVDRSWTRTGPDRYEETDLATGERWTFRLAGGLVVEGPGLALTRT